MSFLDDDVNNLMSHMKERDLDLAREMVCDITVPANAIYDGKGSVDDRELRMHLVYPGAMGSYPDAQRGWTKDCRYLPNKKDAGWALSERGMPLVEFYTCDMGSEFACAKDDPTSVLVGGFEPAKVFDFKSYGRSPVNVAFKSYGNLVNVDHETMDKTVKARLEHAVRLMARYTDFEICTKPCLLYQRSGPVKMLLVPTGDLPREITDIPEREHLHELIGAKTSEWSSFRSIELGGKFSGLCAIVRNPRPNEELPANRVIGDKVIGGSFLICSFNPFSGAARDLDSHTIERMKARFDDPSEGPFRRAMEQMRKTRENLAIPGMTPTQVAELVGRLARRTAKPGDGGGLGGPKH